MLFYLCETSGSMFSVSLFVVLFCDYDNKVTNIYFSRVSPACNVTCGIFFFRNMTFSLVHGVACEIQCKIYVITESF